MKKSKLPAAVMLFLLSSFPMNKSYAAIAAMQGVNEETKECALIGQGDENVFCVPPKGWAEFKGQCPQSYKDIGHLNPQYCTRHYFSCSDGWFSAHKCETMLINHANKQCAFVGDAAKCSSLSKDWEKADKIECPEGYVWATEPLKCPL